jgi:hypothetical protein
MSEQWYWMHGRELRGPLDTASLEQLIAQHRISDHDQIRLASDETWLSGSEAKGLFAGVERTASSSEAAARLLSQARRLQAPEEAVPEAPGESLHLLQKSLGGIIRNAGGPIERSADALAACLRFAVQHSKWLLGLAAVVLATGLAMNLQFGSEARYRNVHTQLTAIWQNFDERRTGKPSAAELRAFVDANLPVVESELEMLTYESQQAPGRSADSFAWLSSHEQNWNAAHTRNALIQASQALRALLRQSPNNELSEARVAVFQQHMAIASERLAGEGRTATAHPILAGRAHNRTSGAVLLIAAVVMLDAVLIFAGVRYWRR